MVDVASLKAYHIARYVGRIRVLYNYKQVTHDSAYSGKSESPDELTIYSLYS